MKIGIVCPYDIDRGGGVQEHVLAQATELQKRGYEVRILTPKPRNQDVINDIPVQTIYIGTSTKVKTPLKTSLELGASFKRDEVDDILDAEKFDLLHIHEPEVPLLGSQIVAKASCPIVATFHAIHPETPLAWTIGTMRIPYSKSIFSKLTELTAVSDAAAGFVRERTERKVHIIPNGIDLKKYTFKSQAKAPTKKDILYIGRLEKRKGVIYLLKAYAILAAERDDVSLVLAGDGDQRDSLEEYVKSNKIPRVSFLGFVSEKDKFKLLHQAALFCSPAIYGESFGIVLLEAMASGTVTVAGANVGYSSVLNGTGRLSLVNPKQKKEFARRLDVMLDDQGVRQNWLDWAEKAVKQYDYPKVVDQYEVVYKKLKTATKS
ncbi:MAG: glycosyltransferase family 4 protein [Candidatus Saccharimonadales bacterium]